MVRIRLQRSGAKKRPYYRIVAAEGSFPVDGRFIEIIGYYHPIEKTDVLKIDEEKASLFTELGINQKFEALKKEAKNNK